MTRTGNSQVVELMIVLKRKTYIFVKTAVEKLIKRTILQILLFIVGNLFSKYLII